MFADNAGPIGLLMLILAAISSEPPPNCDHMNISAAGAFEFGAHCCRVPDRGEADRLAIPFDANAVSDLSGCGGAALIERKSG